MTKRLLKIAAGINLGVGGLLLLMAQFTSTIRFIDFLAGFFMVVAVVRLVVGTVFLVVAQKNDEEFLKGKTYVLIASILSILTGHFITFILGIVAYSNMDTNAYAGSYREGQGQNWTRPELTEEEKSQRRLRNLLALGCFLVLLSGLIFAMTTWETLSGIGKTIALVFATMVFYGMSYFSENKFNLKSSANTYYILSNAFCVFTFIAVGYFRIFGDWFSLYGAGVDLYKTFLAGLVGVLGYLAYLKYDKENIIYLVELSVISGIIYLFRFFTIPKDMTLLVLTGIFATFALTNINNKVARKANNLSKILIPVTSLVLFSFVVNNEGGIFFNLISFAILFVSTYYLAIVEKEEFYKVFAPIFSLGMAFSFIITTEASSKVMFLQLLLVTIGVYAIGWYKRDEKSLFITSSVVCDLAFLYIIIDTLSLDYNYYAIAAAIALLGTSVTVSISNKFGKYYFELLIEPIKVILLSYTIYELLYKFEYREKALFVAIVGLIFALICIVRKDFMKRLYFYGAITVTFLTIFATFKTFAPVTQILLVGALVVLLITEVKSKDENLFNFREVTYGLLLVSLAMVILNTSMRFDMKILGVVLLTIIYSSLFFIFTKNSIFRCFTIVGLLVPYVVILPISVWNDEVNYILYSLPWLALIFIYTREFLKTVNLRNVNIVEGIVLSVWYLPVISKISMEVAIFVGLISFASILIGYRSDKWISLYYTGIAFLILNTIVQLKEFWMSIPIWAYILVAGLILIGIVTYKEYKKTNKGNDVEEVEVEVIQKTNEAVSEPVDYRAILTGSLLYVVFIPILLGLIL